MEADNSDNLSDVSDANPEDVLNSLKNIDDLDAELFGPKKGASPAKSKSTKQPKASTEKKRVSFHDSVDFTDDGDKVVTPSAKPRKNAPVPRKDDDFDFDLDDPLAGILSDEDIGTSKSPKSKSGGASDKRKESAADDWLFADDDADDLLDDGGGGKKKEQTKREPSQARMSVESLMKPTSTDDILKRSSQPAKKMTIDDFASNAAKLSPDQLKSPYTVAAPAPTTSKEITFDDDFGFGSYQPTLTPTISDSKRKGRARSAPTQSTNDDFFDFLKDEPASDASPKLQRDASSPVPSKQESPTRSSLSSSRPRSADIAGPSVEVEGNQRPRPRSSETSTSQKQRKPEVVYDTPVLSSAPEQAYLKPALQEPPAVPAATTMTKAPPTIQPHRQSRRSVDSPFLDVFSPAPSMQRPVSPLPRAPSQPRQAPEISYVQGGHFATDQMTDGELLQVKALLHNAELGYKADLELTKTTYESRIEMLKASFEDLKSRVDRELASVRESYSARIGVLREAMQNHTSAEASRECEHQNEIQRLRNLHLEALEECRRDWESQKLRQQEAHASELEAIKSSTYHARNIETVMSRVEEATGKLQQLSSKYESAYRAVTQQSESVALSNKQLISVVQNQMNQQQRSTCDAQIQLQQTASRLEGMVSEMNRKMEEQHYAMQLSHSNLQSAHVALQEERKQFMQQITMEREHLRKAHREMMSLQNDTQREAREDRDKLLRAAEELTSTAARYEEAKVAEAERSNKRNREHEETLNKLNTEKMELAKRKAQLETADEKLLSQKRDLNEKLARFTEEKQMMQQIHQELEQKEAEIQMLEQRTIESGADKEKMLSEAKRIEDGHNRRLAEIHSEMNELGKQRQMLAEERRALAHMRGAGLDGSKSTQETIAQSPAVLSVTPVKQRLMLGHPGSPGQSPGPSIALWRHSAQQDRSFLDGEQFFLETLKHSPYSKK